MESGSLMVGKGRPRRFWIPIIALLFIVFALMIIERPDGDDGSYGPVMQLTFGDTNDEDGAFALADDGTIYFAWMSDRAGNTDHGHQKPGPCREGLPVHCAYPGVLMDLLRACVPDTGGVSDRTTGVRKFPPCVPVPGRPGFTSSRTTSR